MIAHTPEKTCRRHILTDDEFEHVRYTFREVIAIFNDRKVKISIIASFLTHDRRREIFLTCHLRVKRLLESDFRKIYTYSRLTHVEIIQNIKGVF